MGGLAHRYSADLHLGHKRIIEFCKRRFNSIDEMNAVPIRTFQDCVGYDDDLWSLGNFSFGKAKERIENWFHQLPWRKH